jgi:hypothetical protein
MLGLVYRLEERSSYLNNNYGPDFKYREAS